MQQLLQYRPDKKIADYNFSLHACLGKGSSGTVYLGKHQGSDILVAIKVIDFKTLKNDYDAYQTSNNTYIITEYCKGGDLKNLMQQKKIFTEKESIIIIKDIMNGLYELHKNGIIHRDLKPANILVDDDQYKIIDFGFAISLDFFQDQMMSSLVGTPLYMSPQILRKQAYTSKCDVWSLGLIFYELLYGYTPWPSNNLLELIHKVTTFKLEFPYGYPQHSPEIKEFIKGCLAFREEDRFSWEDVYNHRLFKMSHDKRVIMQDNQRPAIYEKDQQFRGYRKISGPFLDTLNKSNLKEALIANQIQNQLFDHKNSKITGVFEEQPKSDEPNSSNKKIYNFQGNSNYQQQYAVSSEKKNILTNQFSPTSGVLETNISPKVKINAPKYDFFFKQPEMQDFNSKAQENQHELFKNNNSIINNLNKDLGSVTKIQSPQKIIQDLSPTKKDTQQNFNDLISSLDGKIMEKSLNKDSGEQQKTDRQIEFGQKNSVSKHEDLLQIKSEQNLIKLKSEEAYSPSNSTKKGRQITINSIQTKFDIKSNLKTYEGDYNQSQLKNSPIDYLKNDNNNANTNNNNLQVFQKVSSQQQALSHIELDYNSFRRSQPQSIIPLNHLSSDKQTKVDKLDNFDKYLTPRTNNQYLQSPQQLQKNYSESKKLSIQQPYQHSDRFSQQYNSSKQTQKSPELNFNQIYNHSSSKKETTGLSEKKQSQTANNYPQMIQNQYLEYTYQECSKIIKGQIQVLNQIKDLQSKIQIFENLIPYINKNHLQKCQILILKHAYTKSNEVFKLIFEQRENFLQLPEWQSFQNEPIFQTLSQQWSQFNIDIQRQLKKLIQSPNFFDLRGDELFQKWMNLDVNATKDFMQNLQNFNKVLVQQILAVLKVNPKLQNQAYTLPLKILLTYLGPFMKLYKEKADIYAIKSQEMFGNYLSNKFQSIIWEDLIREGESLLKE